GLGGTHGPRTGAARAAGAGRRGAGGVGVPGGRDRTGGADRPRLSHAVLDAAGDLRAAAADHRHLAAVAWPPPGRGGRAVRGGAVTAGAAHASSRSQAGAWSLGRSQVRGPRSMPDSTARPRRASETRVRSMRSPRLRRNAAWR